MKKPDVKDENELRPEYDLESLQVRKYGPERSSVGRHGVVLEPDVAAFFPDSNAVNEALRFLMRVAKEHEPRSPKEEAKR
jgi:hypothetical protein